MEKEKAKITGLKVSNFKRVKLIEFRPDENGLTILGGRNRQGKSSVLSAIAYALGGDAFRPTSVNNTESDESATIRVEIDGLIVERKGKNADLRITDARGMKGNQTLLNTIVSKFALNLGTFINASETEKAKMLLNMFPELETALADLNSKAETIRETRADVNRDIKRLQVKFDEMPNYPEAPAEEIKIEDLTAELQKANAAEAESAEHRAMITKEEQELNRLENESISNQQQTEAKQGELAGIETRFSEDMKALEAEYVRQQENLRNRFEQRKNELNFDIQALKTKKTGIENAISSKQEELSDMKAALTGSADFSQIKAEIMERMNQANTTNAQVRANQERKSIYSQIETARQQSADRTKELEEIDAQRKAILQNANLPLPELEIDEETKLQYRGQRWDCMSGAEKLKVATAICMQTKPGCGFVLIDGLEQMDAETLNEFSEYLAEKGMQGIGTIVGDTKATVIIEDGQIKDTTSENNNQ